MRNQKRVLEIFLYLILLCVFIFFYFTDVEIELFDNDTKLEYSENDAPYLEEVPEELIDYDFEFKGD